MLLPGKSFPTSWDPLPATDCATPPRFLDSIYSTFLAKVGVLEVYAVMPRDAGVHCLVPEVLRYSGWLHLWPHSAGT
jgi:hypothetical protein